MKEIDKIDELIGRLNQNYDYYQEHVMEFGKEQIIEMAGRIHAMKDAHYYMTVTHTFDYEQAEYLLKFKNPLEIVADKWEERQSDISDMSFDMDGIFYARDAENAYELMDTAAPATEKPEAEAKTGDAKPKNPSVLDRRLNEHEFFKAINKLIPDNSPIALSSWISYANNLDYNHDSKFPAAQTLSKLIAEFTDVKQMYGDEIAEKVFNTALEICIDPVEIRAAAFHLNNGMDINEVVNLSLSDKLIIPESSITKPDTERIVMPNEQFDNPQLKSASREEAQRLLNELKSLDKPNHPDNDIYYSAKVSDEFIGKTGSAYYQHLYYAFEERLPITFGGITGKKGSFISVTNSVRKKLTVEKEKSSLLGQLADAKKEATAQNQPGKGNDKKTAREEL